jgi:Protein of unknown function (DUF1499)
LRVLRRMITGIVLALLILAGLAIGLRLYMGRAAEDRLRRGEDIALADFRGPLPQNGFLACPAGYCAIAPDMTSPALPLPVARLGELWPQALQDEPRLVTAAAEPERHRLVLIQHSAGFRFPDVITVEFVTLGPEQSSLAVYSRARYGKLDFSVNRRRVESWLARLERLAANPPAR